ncbi:hypothetical protein ABPG75_009168 [Micractinium tetrahymenae]
MSTAALAEASGLQGSQSAVYSSQEASQPPGPSQQQPLVAAAPAPPAHPPHRGWLPNAHVLHGEISLPGSRYGSLNQDFVATQELHEGGYLRRHPQSQCYMTVVLDGHGMLGELAAREAGVAILHSIRDSELRHKQLEDMAKQEVEAMIRAAFLAGHLAALRVFDNAPRTYDFPKGSSMEERYVLGVHPPTGDKAYTAAHAGSRMLEFGTTATLAIVQGTSLAIGNVGDSLAVLGREEGEEYLADVVTERHFGWDPAERARVEAACGDSATVSQDDGYLIVEEGRLRGFQLGMTRALGHRLLSQYGVSSIPTVSLHKLAPEHMCLIVATDGVWEVLGSAAAVKLVCDALAEGHTPGEAARQLAAEAVHLADGPVRAQGAADNTTVSLFVFAEL